MNKYTSITGSPAPPMYDNNGNALSYPVKPVGASTLVSGVFTWDINNQLIAATAGTDSASYQYDALGRRTKRNETISGVTTHTWFFTNTWNVELEHDGSAYTRRLSWGLDLSQSPQGAGGVGGLVMSEDLPSGSGAPIPHFPTYDGNGNITAWVNTSGTVIARQRYDAYGNIIHQTGTAPSNYGFSTKPMDLVTGLLYYGYRYYDPITGRWPSRDPIGERGGINLYGFVRNNGTCRIDRLGLVNITESGWANTNVRIERKFKSREYYHLMPEIDPPHTTNDGKCVMNYRTRHMEVTQWDVFQYGLWYNASAEGDRDDRNALAALMAAAAIANAANPAAIVGGAVFLAVFYFTDKYLVTVDYEELLHIWSSDTTYRIWSTPFSVQKCDCACEYESCKSKPNPLIDPAQGGHDWDYR